MNKPGTKALKVLVVITILIFISAHMEAQCAMCKQAAETSLKSNPKSIARGLNSGILYLMAIPYVMIMFIFRKQLAQLFVSFKSRFLKVK